MNRPLATCTFLLALGGCAAGRDSGLPVISFAETNPAGVKVRELAFALTDTPAKTCSAGDWKVAKPLKDPTGYAKSPAYLKEGAELRLLLVSTICDAYDSYSGTLKGSAFQGEHVQYGLGFSKSLGTVTGSYSVP